MMRTKILLLALTLCVGFFSVQVAQAKIPAQTQNSSQSVILDMQNMTCAMCKITIRKALQRVDGVQTVTVDADHKTASVTFDPQKTKIEALITATTNVGYPASIRQSK